VLLLVEQAITGREPEMALGFFARPRDQHAGGGVPDLEEARESECGIVRGKDGAHRVGRERIGAAEDGSGRLGR
jgi:hypothetical protein